MAKAPAVIANTVYGDYNKKLRAKYIYFYYLRHTGNPQNEVEAYVIKKDRAIVYDDMMDEIEDIVRQIKSGAFQQPSGWSLGDLRWRHKSYFVVVLDDNQQKLIRTNAVTFEFVGNDLNHSFRDGQDIRVVDVGVSGFFCLNHMISKASGELGDEEKEHFKVTANHNKTGEPGSGFLTHSDSGTNMGPPLSP